MRITRHAGNIGFHARARIRAGRARKLDVQDDIAAMTASVHWYASKFPVAEPVVDPNPERVRGKADMNTVKGNTGERRARRS